MKFSFPEMNFAACDGVLSILCVTAECRNQLSIVIIQADRDTTATGKTR